jgi:hypothetical protein
MTTITSIHPEQITIRNSYPDDGGSLRALAALDSAKPLAEPALVAEVNGELHAAISLEDGRVVADPFVGTDHLAVLLHVHAAQLDERWATGRRGRSAAAAASAVWRALSPRDRDLSPTPVAAAPASTKDAVLASHPQAWLRAS